MRTLGIIPARKGSKRVAGKNTRLLLGVPLVEYAIKACANARRLSKVVVSSDDPAVEEIVKKYYNITFIRRPDELAADESPAIDYVRHALKVVDKEGPFDATVIIQPTSPFVQPEDIDNTVELLERTGTDSAVSVVKIEQMHHPFKLKVLESDRLLPYLADEKGIKAAYELPDVYARNGAVYASKLSTILKGSILGESCAGYVMPFERSIDINYPIDFDFAEFLASKKNK